MARARLSFLSVSFIFLLIFFTANVWAGDKIAVVQYNLKPIEEVDSGRFIKTEWSAKIHNKVSVPVEFSLTIFFVDRNNETLKEVTSQCELDAYQTKTFKDTVLVKTSIARKIASTRVTIEETSKEESSP